MREQRPIFVWEPDESLPRLQGVYVEARGCVYSQPKPTYQANRSIELRSPRPERRDLRIWTNILAIPIPQFTVLLTASAFKDAFSLGETINQPFPQPPTIHSASARPPLLPTHFMDPLRRTHTSVPPHWDNDHLQPLSLRYTLRSCGLTTPVATTVAVQDGRYPSYSYSPIERRRGCVQRTC